MRRKLGSLAEQNIQQAKHLNFGGNSLSFFLSIFNISFSCLNAMLLSLIFLFFQCRWRVCRHPHDQGPSVSHRSCPLGAPGHLQVLMLHRRHFLPFRPADLQDEVRFLDVRPRQYRPGALWERGGPKGGNTWMFLLGFVSLSYNWRLCSLVIGQLRPVLPLYLLLSMVHTCSFPKFCFAEGSQLNTLAAYVSISQIFVGVFLHCSFKFCKKQSAWILFIQEQNA